MFEKAHVDLMASAIRSRVKFTDSPLLVGLAGPQGSGKSTLAAQLANALESASLQPVVLSIDDFYLSKSARTDLANRTHPLLATRGVPGTHEADLLLIVINQLLSHTSEKLEWPVFVKALDDRHPTAVNSFVLDPKRTCVAILEGWCVGCLPLKNLSIPINELESTEDPSGVWRTFVNDQIDAKYTPIWSRMDYFLYMHVPTFDLVHEWRRLQSIGNGENLARFNVERFIQFFERVTRAMMQPCGRIPTDLNVYLARDHSIAKLELP